uniref:GP-PDE domain-containing protein n=1 Tax=Amphora coffeiformis TaxID=265554 RepID=A0A7S3KZZ5_9STRA|mmetsp:Transcript_14827/g.28088  ORF Transcript_14827/g.28088 Transcript_14827/m.28088 type:complete len:674 (-) Transcript_14827:107-2128(-)
MVNFGGHLRVIGEEQQKSGDADDDNLYLVPYNVMKEHIYVEPSLFPNAWQQALDMACQDVQRVLTSLWGTVFTVIPPAEVRGCLLGNALELYVQQQQALSTAVEGASVSQEDNNIDTETAHPVSHQDCHKVLNRLSRLHARQITNSEALRKLVKKYDKRYSEAPLSGKFLPALYASSMFTSQSMMENCIETLRAMLEDKDDQDGEDDDRRWKPLQRYDSETAHDLVIESRSDELEWLRRLVTSIPTNLLERLVAHRGFHHVQDRNDKRPLENSLAAYEIAWTSGLYLCECDVVLTRDEKLVLAHDEDFQRLALESGHANTTRRVSDLTFRELLAMPLKSGVRPPLLIDVLRSAHAISEHAQLIIEIKPGSPSTAYALARLLQRHPDLAAAVAMIMSFDSVIMHRLHAELYAGVATTIVDNTIYSSHSNLATTTTIPRMSSRVSLNGQLTTSHRRLISMDHFGTLGMSSSSPPLHDHHHRHSNSWNLSSSPPPTLHGGHHQNHHHHPIMMTTSTSGLGLDLSQGELDAAGLEFGRAGSRGNLQRLEPENEMTKKQDSWIPKLMLLTVANPPKKPCEMRVSVTDLSPVDSWLQTNQGSLDGVYLQFEPSMTTPEGAAALRELSQRHLVGIWGYSGKDPDDYNTFHCLVEQGNVTFVNTDLPTHFRKEILKRSGTV